MPSTSNTGGVSLQRKESDSTTNTPPTGQVPAHQPEQAPGHRPTLGRASPPADTSAALRDELDPRGLEVRDAEPSPAPSTRNTGGILLQRRPIRGTSEFEPMPVGRIAGAANGPRELSESTAPGREFIDMQAPLETPDELGQPESFRAPDVRGPLSIVQANRRALAPLPNTEQHLAYVPTPEALPTDPLDPSIERTLTAVLRNAARRHGIEI